jgi:hypothetical protein
MVRGPARVLALGAAMSPHMQISALSGLVPGQEPDSWNSQGEQPRRLSLVPRPDRAALGPGWYRLRLRLVRVASDQDARLILYPADGLPQRTMRLPVAINGLLDHVFKIPFKAAALELQPFSGTGLSPGPGALKKIATHRSRSCSDACALSAREGGMRVAQPGARCP